MEFEAWRIDTFVGMIVSSESLFISSLHSRSNDLNVSNYACNEQNGHDWVLQKLGSDNEQQDQEGDRHQLHHVCDWYAFDQVVRLICAIWSIQAPLGWPTAREEQSINGKKAVWTHSFAKKSTLRLHLTSKRWLCFWKYWVLRQKLQWFRHCKWLGPVGECVCCSCGTFFAFYSEKKLPQ